MDVETREDLENIIDAGDASESSLAFDLLESLEENEQLQAENLRLRAVAHAARKMLDASIFPGKYPHVGTLRDAVAHLDAITGGSG